MSGMRRLCAVVLLAGVVAPAAAWGQSNDPALQMLQDEADRREAIDDELLNMGVRALMQEMFVADPEQIEAVQEETIREQEALQYSLDPVALRETLDIDLTQGQMPQSLMVAPGRVTVVALVDASGQPWPIVDLATGDTQESIVSLSEHGDNQFLNTFTITPRATSGTTNISILLADRFLTFSIKIEANRTAYHENPILRVNEFGPQAEMAEVQSIGSMTNDEIMKAVAARQAPEGMEQLETSTSDAHVWRSNDGEFYIATRHQLRIPLARSTYNSGSGIRAYRTSEWNSLHLVDDRGNSIIVDVERDI